VQEAVGNFSLFLLINMVGRDKHKGEKYQHRAGIRQNRPGARSEAAPAESRARLLDIFWFGDFFARAQLIDIDHPITSVHHIH
jgi:hypothetical protein